MAHTRLLIADDHPLFLEGLVTLLSREKDFVVCAAVPNGKEALNFLAKESADVCILDVNMPEKDGIETVKEIRNSGIQTRIIMLTTYNDIEFIRMLIRMDVSGYVLKNSTGEELVNAVHKVLEGGNWFSPEVQKSIADDFVNSEKKKNEPAIVLTPRETDIVRLLAKEMTNEEIAQKLFISFRTVETHRKNIMQKTGAKNIAGLINFAHSHGLLK